MLALAKRITSSHAFEMGQLVNVKSASGVGQSLMYETTGSYKGELVIQTLREEEITGLTLDEVQKMVVKNTI